MFTTRSADAAAPVVQSVTQTSFASSTTSHNVNIPAVSTGDLLLVLIGFDVNYTITTPSGWTQLFTVANGGWSSMAAYYKIVPSNASATTVDFVSSTATTMGAQTYRITGASSPISAGTSVAYGTLVNQPNPPSLNPGWGTKDTLWIAMANQNQSSTITSVPTNYANGLTTNGAGGGIIHSATRTTTAASEDPGVFTFSGSWESLVNTIAIGTQDPPTWSTTTNTSNITASSADVFTGFNPNSSDTTAYVRYSTSSPGTCNTSFGSGTAPLGFGAGSTNVNNTWTLTGLAANTLYYWCAYATNAGGTTYMSPMGTFTTAAATPTITTPTSASIVNNSALLGGNITAQGGSAVTAKGICYALTATNANPQSGGSGVTCTPEGTGGTGLFTQTISGLTQNSNYSYTAYATNTQGTAYTSAGTFTTLGVPAVTTSAASSLTTTGATLNAIVDPNGASTNVSYLWGATAGVACNLQPNTLAGPTGLTGTANVSPNATALSGLTANKNYYYCVMATNSYGTTYGTVVSFTTSPTPGAYAMLAAGSVLGTPDCDDNIGGQPCSPLNLTASQISGTQINLSWSANGVPAPSSYTLYWCNRTSVPGCNPVTQQTGNVSTGSTSYSNTGLTTATQYAYSLIATNGSGNSAPATTLGTTGSCTNQTIYPDNDGDGVGTSGTITQGLTTTGGVDSGSSTVINKPADVVNGDLMVAAMEWDGGSSRTVSPPAGWTQIGSTVNNGTDNGIAMWYKYASSEGSNYTWTKTGGNSDMSGWITSFGNVAISTPIGNTTSGTGSSANHTAASLTPTAGNYMLVMAAGNDDAVYSYTPPSGMTEFVDKEPVTNSDRIGGFTQWITGTGATGSKTAVYGQSWGYATLMFELKRISSTSTTSCVPPVAGGWSLTNTDCDDNTTTYYQTLSSGYPDYDGDGVNPSSTAGACSGSSLRPGVGASSGTDCNSTDGGKWQNLTGYTDADNDTYTTGGSVQVCSGSTVPSGYRATASGTADCYDTNSNAKPGQSSYFTTDRGDGSYDYDCDSGTNMQYDPQNADCGFIPFAWVYGRRCASNHVVTNQNPTTFRDMIDYCAGQYTCTSNPYGTMDGCTVNSDALGNCTDNVSGLTNTVCCPDHVLVYTPSGPGQFYDQAACGGTPYYQAVKQACK